MKKVTFAIFLMIFINSCSDSKKDVQQAKIQHTKKALKKYLVIKIKDEYIFSNNFLNSFYHEKPELYFEATQKASKLDGIKYKYLSNELEQTLIKASINVKSKYKNYFSIDEINRLYESIVNVYNRINMCPNLRHRLENYLILECTEGLCSEIDVDLRNTIVSNNFDEVDYSYFQEENDTPPLIFPNPSTSQSMGMGSTNSTLNQKYLDELRIQKIWESLGPLYMLLRNKIGNGVKLVDIEGGWDTSHRWEFNISQEENLRGYNSTNAGSFEHGTQVLGIIKSKFSLLDLLNSDNASGLAPGTDVKLVSVYQNTDYENRPLALIIAVNEIMKNDSKDAGIILLERYFTKCEKVLPFESERPLFDLIKLAVKCLNIIVVEGAANDNSNLDNLGNCLDFNFYSRKKINFDDSGAIWVGSTYHLVRDYENRLCQGGNTGNYGSRVDTYLFGTYVYTTYINNKYNQFSQTSASAAITAGIVASLQWYAKDKWNRKLTPAQMRAILTNNPDANSYYSNFDYTTHTFKMPNYECLLSKVDKFFNPLSAPLNCQ